MTLPAHNKNAIDIIDRINEIKRRYLDDEPGSREELLSLSSALTAAVELPSEAVMRMGFAEPARLAHCKMAVDLKVFEQLAQTDSGGISAEELAVIAEADIRLMRRMLRHLAAMNMIIETGPGLFVGTPTSIAFSDPKFRDGITYATDVTGPSFQKLPEYFKKMRYQDPSLLPRGPFQYSQVTKSHHLTWLVEHPPYHTIYKNSILGRVAGKPSWVDPEMYPVSSRLFTDFKSSISPVLLVHVGGGLGHDLIELQNKHPELPGQLVLQDREQVVARIQASAAEPDTEASRSRAAASKTKVRSFSTRLLAVESTTSQSEPASALQVFQPMIHDFFKRQPVRHARAYYLHSILRKRSDDECLRILEAIVPSMKFGYSRILINDIVVPDEGAPWSTTTLDWLAMALVAGKERTEGQWKEMMSKVGLQVNKVYSYALGCESLIEAELASPDLEGPEPRLAAAKTVTFGTNM